MANVGLFTPLILKDFRTLFIKKVFPVPRFPFRIITWPGLTVEENSSANISVSCSLNTLCDEGNTNSILVPL
jgi:hypothetical protein